MADSQEVLAWWRKRQHLLTLANETSTPMERWTLHIEKPFIEKMHQEAEAGHVTVTAIANRLFRYDDAGG